MNLKKVSIGIPTFNRKKLVRKAIFSSLSQTYTNLEVIVSDDCSNDSIINELLTIKDSRLKVFQQHKNLGMVGNWNFCLNQAEGYYFVLLGDDDFLSPNFIEETVNFYNSNPELAFVHTKTNSYQIDEGLESDILLGTFPSSPPIIEGSDLILQKFLGYSSVSFCSILFKRESLLGLGGFPSEYPYAADIAVWMRLAYKGKVGYIDKPLSNFRNHSSNLTVTLSIEKKSFDNYRIAQLAIEEACKARMDKYYIKKITKIGRIRTSRATVNRLLSYSVSGVPKIEIINLIFSLKKCLKGDFFYVFPRIIISAFVSPSLYLFMRNSFKKGIYRFFPKAKNLP
jgi:glycosyltransferase involved in cell wall biosynthesis